MRPPRRRPARLLLPRSTHASLAEVTLLSEAVAAPDQYTRATVTNAQSYSEKLKRGGFSRRSDATLYTNSCSVHPPPQSDVPHNEHRRHHPPSATFGALASWAAAATTTLLSTLPLPYPNIITSSLPKIWFIRTAGTPLCVQYNKQCPMIHLEDSKHSHRARFKEAHAVGR